MIKRMIIPLILILVTPFEAFTQPYASVANKAEFQNMAYSHKVLLKQNPKSYLIRSIPEGAAVFLDDKLKGKTPIYIEVYPGYHRIKLIKNGYMILSDTIFLSKKDKVIDYTLQRINDSTSLSINHDTDYPYYWMSNKNQYDTSRSVGSAINYSYIPEGYQVNQYKAIDPAKEAKYKRRVITYAILVGATGAVAVSTAIVVQNKYSEYTSATDDATNLHNQIKTLDVIFVSATVACGVSLAGVILNSLWLYDERTNGVQLSIIPIEKGAMISANIKF